MAATETQIPTMTLGVTEPAAEEIRKFMSGEEGLPETAGLRVRVVPGGCSGFTFKNPNATGGCGCGTSFTA